MKYTSTILGIVFVLLAPSLSAQDGLANPSDLQASLDDRALAVLPVEFLTDDPQAAGLAEAAYAAVLAELSTVEGLNVLSHASVAQYAGSALSPETIGRELGIAHVVDSYIRRDARTFYFGMQYVDARSGRASWEAGSMIGFLSREGILDPTLYLEHMESDGIESKLYPDQLLEQMLSRLVDNVENTLYPKPPEMPRDPEVVRAENTAIFVDTSRSLRERMDAFGELRVSGRRDLRPEILAAAVEIAISSDSTYVKKTIWQQLAHVEDASLVEPLLQSLATDSHWLVRQEAAKALENFVEEPRVRLALEHARTNDPAEQVRRALQFLGVSEEDQIQQLRQTALDANQEDWDRARAFSALRRANRDAVSIDDGLLMAMTELARTADNPRVRESLLRGLTLGSDPDLTPILNALATDESTRVRETMTETLARYLERPGVRSALEEASVADTSPIVRRAAEEALHRPGEHSPEVATETILDPWASEQEKVDAWEHLRWNASESWSDAIVTEAVRIGTTSPYGQFRAQIWRGANADTTHPLFLQPLLAALSTDPDQNVREAAAQTLVRYLEQPGVRAALEVASQQDSDAEVRGQAELTLTSPRE